MTPLSINVFTDALLLLVFFFFIPYGFIAIKRKRTRLVSLRMSTVEGKDAVILGYVYIAVGLGMIIGILLQWFSVINVRL